MWGRAVRNGQLSTWLLKGTTPRSRSMCPQTHKWTSSTKTSSTGSRICTFHFIVLPVPSRKCRPITFPMKAICSDSVSMTELYATHLFLLYICIVSQLQHYEDWHFQCMQGYFSVSKTHETLTWTPGSLMCVCDLFACISTWGTSVYSLILCFNLFNLLCWHQCTNCFAMWGNVLW